MNIDKIKKLLKENGQEQLLEYYGELDDKKRAELLDDISHINFSVTQCLNQHAAEKNLKNIAPINAKSLNEIKAHAAEYREEGLKLLQAGKVAAVILAGGQGTRLGFDKPKGMYDIGVSRKLSIFGQLMSNIQDVTKLYGGYFHLFIMTSEINNDDTVAFFKENDYFGYPKDKIHFYIQNKEPVCGLDGKIFLSEKHRVAFSPNGNGGWYSSLVNSGLPKILEKEGVEWLNVFGVDNVLQRICDPVFIGATSIERSFCGAKVVRKTCPEERVGVLCSIDGRPDIIEYYELPKEVAEMKDEHGELAYPYGVILNYLFNVHVLNAIISWKLPYHLAQKKVAHIVDGKKEEPNEPNAFKFETLAVDMVRNMGSCLAFEVEREKEFAPIKNATGVDSVESARELLKKNGIKL
ncbi:MAG: UTP--glucose-1-phosphate uridylyltransferase [Clostridia bacterium]|nr:UTP--glucose-1-phosphate uridylyltransferase [Clostridia bacterium]